MTTTQIFHQPSFRLKSKKLADSQFFERIIRKWISASKTWLSASFWASQPTKVGCQTVVWDFSHKTWPVKLAA